MSRASNQELGPGGCRCGCGCGGWDGGDLSTYLSILGGTCTCTVHCTQRSVESEHLFLAGKFFSFFFSWIAWGNLQQQKKKKCFGSFYIFLFLEGAFLVLLLLLMGSTWLSPSLFLSLSFFRGRASLEEGSEERRERRKRQYKVYSQRSSFGLGGRRREGHLEKWEEKVLVFLYLYIFMFYIYILFSCI